jgi:NADH:ubiquinone oxidoreductase subunit F (NADH-binding)
MISAIEGRRGEVRLRPPYPAESGLYGKPTVVNNVETLVGIPRVIERGAEAFRALGTDGSAGTKAICLNHGFANPGIVEVEFGTSLREVIDVFGGGAKAGTKLAAVILGGPMGSILFPEQWDVPVCYAAMSERGISLGHGGLVAVPEGTDFGLLLEHWLRFMQHESCGKCVPCRIGSQRALELVLERNTLPDAAAILRLLDTASVASLCAFGQLMPAPARTLIERFGAEIFGGAHK